MLQNLTIKTRLVFVLCFLCCQLIVGSMMGIFSLRAANDTMASMYDDRLVALGQLDHVIRLLNRNQILLSNASLLGAEKGRAQLDQIEDNIADADRTWKAFVATYLTPQEKDLATRFADARHEMVTRGIRPAIEALRAGDTLRAVELTTGTVMTSFVPVREACNKLIQLQLDESARMRQEAQARYEFVRNSNMAALAVGLVIALTMGIWLVRSIVGPLKSAVRIAESVAQGDLTQRIDARSADETGQLLKALAAMNASLFSMVSQVREATDAIHTGTNEIATGNMDLSSRTEQQAANLEETASSMEQLTATVRHNADSARQGNQVASAAATVAEQGGEVVGSVVRTMSDISDASRRIADITAVIDGIAFQTNILALNAAVEAARAGEQGRGFAVVAGEVRSLAQRSAEAAKEIKALIDDSSSKVEAGSQLAQSAGQTMQQVVESVKRVTDIMSEISAASTEQASGIEQVNVAVGQMDQVTQQNAALVEEASAAAGSMQSQVRRLTELVGKFRLPSRGVAGTA